MANGRIASSAPSANTNTSIYTCGVATGVTVVLMMVNRGTTDAVCRVAICVGTGTPGNTDWIEYNFVVPANGGTFERSGIVLSNTEQVVVWTDSANTSWRLTGFDS